MAWSPEEELARLRAMRLGTGEQGGGGFMGAAPVVGGLGMGTGPLVDAPVQGGLDDAPVGGFWGGLKRFAQAAAPYVGTGLRLAGNTAINLASGDPTTAARMQLASQESQQRGRALEIEESKARSEALREAQMQQVYGAMQANPPRTQAERQRYAMMLAPYDSRMASVLMKPDAAGGEPLVTVNENGRPVLRPRSQAEGLEAYRAPPRTSPVEAGIAALLNANAAKPTNAVASEAQRKVLDANGTLARLSEIRDLYRPEYQQVGTQLRAIGMEWSEKLGGDLNPEDKERLDAYTEYRAAAYDHMSTILNQLSGAAISPAEAERLLKSLPDPGTGIGGGDSPTKFQSKLDRAEKTARMALARYSYALSQGIPVDSAPLTEAKLKNAIGEKAEKAARNAGATTEQAQEAGVRAVQAAFGE